MVRIDSAILFVAFLSIKEFCSGRCEGIIKSDSHTPESVNFASAQTTGNRI